MRSSALRAIITALVIIVSLISLRAQTQTTAKSTKPSGSVAGRVTIKDKGAARIGVGLRRSESNHPFDTLPRATTDQDGNYKITNVSSGSYTVVPGASAYIIANNNNARGRNVIVGEGENVEGINFSLVRGGVITGKITDPDGRPVIQQQVRLFRFENPDSRTPQQGQVAFPVNNTTTDDRGIYRMYGLVPGRYRVSSGRGDETFSSFSPAGRIIYSEIFYPDATEQAKGTVIEVSEGSEATNIDITLGRPVETFTATGRVVDGEKGQPVPNIRFGLQRLIGSEERAEFINAFMNTNVRGDFVVEGLIPGKYGVFVMPEQNSEIRAESTTFDIIDGDVSGITIRLIKGAAISGVVVLETDDKRALAKLSQLQMQAYVQNPGGGVSMGASSRATIGGDGTFRIGGLPGGTANLTLSPTMDMNQMKGFAVTRIERDGVVQPRGIEVKEGEQVAGVRVIVSYGSAVLRGVVTIENGPLPEGARISVWLAKPGEMQFNIRPPTVDERGRFMAEGIPAGTYEILVSVFGRGLKPRPPLKQLITLQDGVATDLAITFDLAAGTKP